MRPLATSVRGLKLLVYEALNYYRFEARIADRAVSLVGLPDKAVVDVNGTQFTCFTGTIVQILTPEHAHLDSFRSPKPATLATSCFSRAVFGKGKVLSLLALLLQKYKY